MEAVQQIRAHYSDWKMDLADMSKWAAQEKWQQVIFLGDQVFMCRDLPQEDQGRAYALLGRAHARKTNVHHACSMYTFFLQNVDALTNPEEKVKYLCWMAEDYKHFSFSSEQLAAEYRQKAIEAQTRFLTIYGKQSDPLDKPLAAQVNYTAGMIEIAFRNRKTSQKDLEILFRIAKESLEKTEKRDERFYQRTVIWYAYVLALGGKVKEAVKEIEKIISSPKDLAEQVMFDYVRIFLSEKKGEASLKDLQEVKNALQLGKQANIDAWVVVLLDELEQTLNERLAKA